ncbi:RICIN domain-containing protein, partial [Actinocrinis sp.]|uniref:RICIN domain-containing protein n=1 Tax=Actinocrinis sp. TaxID=1920516 RepID=UPI002D630592
AGTYHEIVNKLTGQVVGTHGNTTDANIGNGNAPDIELENPGSAANPDTQLWHVVTKADGNVTLLNKSGGRAAEIWTGNPTAGQQIGQWVDNTSAGLWKLIKLPDGNVEFQSAGNPSLYLTGASTDAHLTLQTATADGSQEWQLK